MSRLDLPDGGWVEFGDPKLVTYRDRKAIRYVLADVSPEVQAFWEAKAVNPDADIPQPAVNSKDLRAADDAKALMACALVSATSYGLPIPLTPDLLDTLPGNTADLILEAANKEFAAGAALNVEPTLDPASPTEPSAA